MSKPLTKKQLEQEVERLKNETQTAWGNVAYKESFRRFMAAEPPKKDICTHCGDERSMGCY